MALYPYETQLALSGDGGNPVLIGAVVTIYDPSDTGLGSPVALVDTAGNPMTNPIQVSGSGFVPAFQASIPQVMWVGGGFAGYLNSFQGLLTEVRSIRDTFTTASQSVPSGGVDGQVLTKDGGVDYITRWSTPAAGGTGGGGTPTGGGAVQFVRKTGSTWPARPTASTDVIVLWIGADPSPTIVASGTGGMLDNIDIRMVTP